jgi:transketolase
MRNAFAKKLSELAARDSNVMLLTGDLGFSVFEDFQKCFPKQYLNAGISEQGMVGMAAGLALEGKKVFVYSIIPFIAYRALEQIRNDLCYQKLPVKLVGVGSGMAYGRLGGTHHAIDDVGVLCSLPEMTVFSPGDPLEVETILEASMSLSGPCYMRLNRAGDPAIHTGQSIRHWKMGEPLKVTGECSELVVMAMGSALALGRDIIRDLQQGSLYSVSTLKPVQKSAMIDILRRTKTLVVLEEHLARGGLGSLISQVMVEAGISAKVIFASLPDEFVHQAGSQLFLQKHYGLTKENIIKQIYNLKG